MSEQHNQTEHDSVRNLDTVSNDTQDTMNDADDDANVMLGSDHSPLLKLVHEAMGIHDDGQNINNHNTIKATKMDKHTSKVYDEELNTAMNLFLKMGETAAQQVAAAVQALTDVNKQQAENVILGDAEINQYERELDERVLQLVIKRQPTASDLRLIMAMSKGVVDLERIGDEASKIAKMAKELVEQGSAPSGYSEAQHLSNQVRLMIHDALDAFKNFDAEKAFNVMRNDSVINREYQTAIRSLMTYIMEDSRYVSRVLNIMWVLRALERIGDHAKNIAELVIYTASGTDVKHTSYDEVEKTVLNSQSHD